VAPTARRDLSGTRPPAKPSNRATRGPGPAGRGKAAGDGHRWPQTAKTPLGATGLPAKPSRRPTGLDFSRPAPVQRTGGPSGRRYLLGHRAANAHRDTAGTRGRRYFHNIFISQYFSRQGGSSHYPYKGKAVDLQRIGRELNVRYALEGSVQRAGNRMRVNVQLIEAETGWRLWAERSDKPLADLFDMQDEIVSRLANQLNAELIAAEARRAEQAPNPDSMDFYFQGQALLNRGFAPEMLAKARGFFERALELDPGNIDALVGLAGVEVLVCISDMTDNPQALLAEAEARLTKALAAAPNHAYAHLFMGVVLRATYRAPRGVEELERALAIDPNLAGARALMGSALACMGRAQEAEAHVLEALRLSPRDAMIFEWFLVAGQAKMLLGEFAEASSWLQKSIDANRNRPLAFFLLAACLAHLDRLDEARREAKAGLSIDPDFTLRRFRAGDQSDNAVYLAQRARVAEGLRLAGVPEG
jgi:tetratricopeptide (TPR) repeat protein